MELLARRKAKQALPSFIDYIDYGVIPAKHHALIIEKLEAVERGDIKRLMLFLPPGSAKSTYASVLFPPWYLGRNPGKSVIGASHTTELAERFGRRVRNIVATPEYTNIFGSSMSADSSAAGRWEMTSGSEYYAVGVGGSVTGRRADLGIIDDPVKSREDAYSELSRNRVWEWYKADFYTRLKPGAAIILIMTRWHEDDLAGRLLQDAKEGGEQWEVLSLSMEAIKGDPLGRPEGELLWPEWFADEMITQAKRDRRNWIALYQQQPSPDDGDFFHADWFTDYESVPANIHIYGASDYAVTDGGGDYTEHGIFGIDWSGNIYILDWWRGQTSADVWIERQCDFIHKYNPVCWFGEAGPIRRSIEPFMLRRMDERKAFCRVEWLPSVSDKTTRARAIQARAAMGKIFWPKNAPWKTDVMDQMLKFPAGKHDDAVDVFSLFGRGLELVSTPNTYEDEDDDEDNYTGRSEIGGY